MLLVLHVQPVQLHPVKEANSNAVKGNPGINDWLDFLQGEVGCPFLHRGNTEEEEKYNIKRYNSKEDNHEYAGNFCKQSDLNEFSD